MLHDGQTRCSVLPLADLPLWCHLTHLPPFALCAAFPRPRAGRHSGDSSGGSVALALAGGRRSRGTSSSHVRGRGRCPTHPLAWPHWSMASPRRCDDLTVHVIAQVGDGYQTLLPPGAHLHPWGLGFKQSRLHHIGRVERDQPYSAFRQSRRSPSMLLSRWPFGRGSAGRPHTSFECVPVAPGM